MRQFKNYDAVKINSEVEATEFLQYLEDNTNLKWMRGENPTEVSKEFLYNSGFPFFIEVVDGRLLWRLLENTLGFKTKIISLTEFLEPKAINNKKQKLRKQILNKLAKIQKVAELTGMEGKVTLEFTGCTMQEWDSAIESITEYPRYNHFVEVTPKLTVTLLFR